LSNTQEQIDNSTPFGTNSGVASTQGYFDAVRTTYAVPTSGLGGAGWWSMGLDEAVQVGPEILPAPKNVMVSSPLLSNRAYDVRWDPSPDLRILGYAVYRSYTQIGEFERLTASAIQIDQFRDSNSDSFADSEQISLSDKGDPGTWRINQNGDYVIRTCNKPIVEATGLGNPTKNPADIVVEIDGTITVPKVVDGNIGEIVLDSGLYFDSLNSQFVEAALPDLTSDIRISYWYQSRFLNRDVTRHQPPYYKVTAVAYDVENSRLIETDPALVKATTLHIEEIDWIWTEAVRRNAWIAEIAGERVELFMAKKSGVMCGCLYRDEGTYHPSRSCTDCYGTGYVGGYDGPYPMIVVIPFGEKSFSIRETGMRRTDTFDGMWAPPDPLAEQFDLILRQNGTLHQVGPVLRPNHRGFMALQQRFSMEVLNFHNIHYELLKTLDPDLRTLQEDGVRTSHTGANDNTVQLLATKSPEPTVYFKGRTNRYPTIAY